MSDHSKQEGGTPPYPHDLRDLPVHSGSESLGAPAPPFRMVVCAAIRLDTGLVLSAPRPARHHHLGAAWCFSSGRSPEDNRPRHESGFLLDDGTFVDRREAAETALAAGQIAEFRNGNPFLFSEDIW